MAAGHGEKRATIIGGQGFVGGALARHLTQLGWECAVPPRGDAGTLTGHLGHVFYCAGLTADYASRPSDTIEAHVTLASRLLAATSYDSFVYLSSTRLYDSSGGLAGAESADLLLNPNNPRHLYDLSKAMGEAACLAMGGGKARVARLACVYNSEADQDGFLPALLRDALLHRQMRPGDVLEVQSSPHYARDYVHLNDVLSALVLIATQGTQLVYNVASGRNLTNAELFEVVQRATGVRISPTSQALGPPTALVETARMRNEFGWNPADVAGKVEGILRECLAAYLG